MVNTPYSQCRGHGFNPWSGNKDAHATSCGQKKIYHLSILVKNTHNIEFTILTIFKICSSEFDIRSGFIKFWRSAERNRACSWEIHVVHRGHHPWPERSSSCRIEALYLINTRTFFFFYGCTTPTTHTLCYWWLNFLVISYLIFWGIYVQFNISLKTKEACVTKIGNKTGKRAFAGPCGLWWALNFMQNLLGHLCILEAEGNMI